MLKGGSAKTRSIDPDATRGNSARQSPAYNRSNSNGPGEFGVEGMMGSLVIGGRVAGGRPGGKVVDVAVAMRPAARRRLVDAVLGQFLVQGVAVDPEPRGGLDLHAVAGLEHLLDQ